MSTSHKIQWVLIVLIIWGGCLFAIEKGRQNKAERARSAQARAQYDEVRQLQAAVCDEIDQYQALGSAVVFGRLSEEEATERRNRIRAAFFADRRRLAQAERELVDLGGPFFEREFGRVEDRYQLEDKESTASTGPSVPASAVSRSKSAGGEQHPAPRSSSGVAGKPIPGRLTICDAIAKPTHAKYGQPFVVAFSTKNDNACDVEILVVLTLTMQDNSDEVVFLKKDRLTVPANTVGHHGLEVTIPDRWAKSVRLAGNVNAFIEVIGERTVSSTFRVALE